LTNAFRVVLAVIAKVFVPIAEVDAVVGVVPLMCNI
jgi:hypothetical protein